MTPSFNSWNANEEPLYQALGDRAVTFPDLYFDLSEIYDAASGLQLLLTELAGDLTEDGYEPARYLMARLTLRHALELIDGLVPCGDRLGRGFCVQAGSEGRSLVFTSEPNRA